MQPIITPDPLMESFVELPPHSRLPRLDLGVDWESPWGEFSTSVRDFFTGPRPLKEGEAPENSDLRVNWIQGQVPGKAFFASCLSHAAAIVILLLPIWGFLPSADHNLAPVQIESTLYFRAEDLPPISLPAVKKKSAPKARQPVTAGSPAEKEPETYHPRQTILSVPVRVTHPRQTLIQPDAPQTPPKVDPQLPNIIQWAATAPPKPELQLSPTSAAPLVRHRTAKEVAVPEVANNEKNPGPLNIAPSPVINLQPQIPVSAMTARAAQHQSRADSAAAPEIGAAAGDASLHRVIALSATPGPPAPEVSVPQGNLAAHIAISPEGGKSGPSGVTGHADAETAAGNAASAGVSANSLPAAVSVSGGNARAAAGGIRPQALRLNPSESDALTPSPRKGPSVIGAIDPSLPPEKILSGKEVYTLDVNMPNLTSSAGSWVLYFAELDEDDATPLKPKRRLSGPVPIEKVDPKYPPDLINEHVDGEVVLYAIIRKDGSVDSIQVVHKLDPQLDRNAIEALSRWKFRPGTRDGVPVDLETVVHIPFRFRDPRN